LKRTSQAGLFSQEVLGPQVMRMPMDCHKQEKAPTYRAARHTQWEPGGRFPKASLKFLHGG